MDVAAAPLELRAGALRLALRPDVGGSIAGLWHGQEPVLRSVEPAALASARASGCFPLVPYSNRLGHRRFGWDGVPQTTLPNVEEATPHSLHGVGWQRAWQVVSAGADEAVLRHEHAADGHWPFAYDAQQRLRLTGGSLRVEMVVTNRADVAAPVGLGWHPYFPKRATSRLRLACSARWDPDALQLPQRRHPQPGLDDEIADLDLDHCFDGWGGTAQLRDERFLLQLGSSLDRVVVYTPRGKPYFCVEPVSHVSHALGLPDPIAHGMRRVAPGASTAAWMQLDVALA